jgi:hypothetical protein
LPVAGVSLEFIHPFEVESATSCTFAVPTLGENP